MKITVSSCRLEWFFGIEGAVKLLKETGFDGVDYDLRRGKPAPYPTDEIARELIDEEKKQLAAYGLVCEQAHGPFGMTEKCAFDTSDEMFARTVKSFGYYAELGAKYVIVHPVSHADGKEDEIPVNVEMYRALLPYAKKAGVKIATENVFYRTMQTPEKVNRLLREVDDEDLVFCFDSGHSTVVGTAPEDFIAGVDPVYLKCLHLHDNDGVHDRHMLPYTGVMKWDRIIAALKKAGYNGNVNLEIPLYMEGLPHSMMPEAMALAAKAADHIRAELQK